MTSLLSTTNELCLSNRRLVRQSLYRIAVNRRLLNPAWALVGGSGDDDLSGATKICVLCEEPMLLGVECDISGPQGSMFAHFVCYSVWWEKIGRDARSPR